MGLLERLSRHPIAGAVILALLLVAAVPGLSRLNPHHDVIGSFAQSVGQPVPDAVSQLVVAVKLSGQGTVADLLGPAEDLRAVAGVAAVTTPPDPAVWTDDAPETLHTDIIKTVIGSVDPTWAPVYVRLQPDTQPSIVPILRDVLSESDATEWAMAGPPVTRFAQAQMVQQEQVRLLALTTAILTVCLFALSRRVWGAVLPMAAVGAACLLLAGAMGWAGRGLGGPNVLLLPLVVVLGLADSVYLLRAVVRFREHIPNPTTAVVRALQETAPACGLTTATTAIGFGVLALSTSPSLREFGLFAAVGVTIALFTGLGVPLIALGIAPQLNIDAHTVRRPPLWSTLARAVHSPNKRVPTILVALLTCVVLAGVASQATTDLRINGALPASHWARTEAKTVDRVLGGLVDVVFTVDTFIPGGTASPEAFDALIRLQRDIASDPSVGRVFSFADAALWVGRQAGVTPDALTGTHRMNPARRARRFARYYDAAASITARYDAVPLLDKSAQNYVVYVRLRDTGARAWSELLDSVARRDDRESRIHVGSTGTVLFFAEAREQVSADAVRIVAASILSSLAVLAIVFRRIRAIAGATLVLVTTGLAAVAVFGVSGAGVQRLHLFAFSAALGVGIDPLVHLHAALRQRQTDGAARPLADAISQCAVPIQRTWLVLTIGLACLLTSRVPEIREVSVVLVVAFGANLLATATAFVAVLSLRSVRADTADETQM